MIDLALGARAFLDLAGARHAGGGIFRQGGRGIVAMGRDGGGERGGVLDRLRRALREIGQLGLCGVAEQGDATLGERLERRAVEQGPAQPGLAGADQLAGLAAPALEAVEQEFPVALVVPEFWVALGLPAPGVLHQGHDIDDRAAAQGVMNEMGALAEPETGGGAPERLGQTGGGRMVRQAVWPV